MLTRTKALIAASAVAAVTVVPATTGAAADPAGAAYCATAGQSVTFPNAGFNAGGAATLVVAHSWYPRSLTVSADIAAGEYEVITAAYDGYDGRAGTDEQAYEQYVLEFLDAGGAVIATSGMNADLVDFIEEASWTGPVGTVVLNRPATAVRATHAHLGDAAVIAIGEAQSVQPSCFGVTSTAPPTTTTTTEPTDSTTTTTTEPTTSEPPTTTEPPSTTEPPTTTILGPTTSVTTTTTTTVPTQVLPSSQEMPDPDPVAATPTFTG